MSTAPTREDLVRWIAQTRRHQRILSVVLGALCLVSAGLLFWRKEVGGIAIAITALTGISGFWLTAGHLTAWKAKLAELAHPRTHRVAGGERRF